MEQTTTQPSRQLERPREGRSVAGVAAAIANYSNVSVGLVRVIFVVAIFFGGVGLAAYLAGWVLIREEGEERSLVEGWLGNATSPTSWIGLGLVALAVLAIVSSIDAFSSRVVLAAALVILGVLMYRGSFDDAALVRRQPPGVRAEVADDSSPTPAGDPDADDPDADDPEEALLAARQELDADVPPPVGAGPPRPPTTHTVEMPVRTPRPRSRLGRFTFAALLIVLGSMAVADTADLVGFAIADYLAVALMIVGAGLLIGALFGRAYTLIIVGLVLVAGVQFTTWFDVRLGGGFGDPRFSAVTAEQVEPTYELLAGELHLDLSDLDPTTVTATDVSVGAGELRVIVPDDMNIVVDMRVIAGELTWPETVVAGTDLDRRYQRSPEGAVGTIEIDAAVGFGQLIVQLDAREG